MTRRMLCLILVTVGVAWAAPDHKEICSVYFKSGRNLRVEVLYGEVAPQVEVRLDDETSHADLNYASIRLTPSDWRRFVSAYNTGGSVTLADADAGIGATLALSKAADGLELIIKVPDPATHGAGHDAHQVDLKMTAKDVAKLARRWPRADQALAMAAEKNAAGHDRTPALQAHSTPGAATPAATPDLPDLAGSGGVWKLQAIKVVDGPDDNAHGMHVLRSDSKGGEAEYSAGKSTWKLSWAFDQDLSTIQGGEKIKVTLTNKGPGDYGSLVPTISVYTIDSHGGTPLGDDSYAHPNPEPFAAFQYYPKDPNPAVKHYWRKTSQSKDVLPGKDDRYNDTMDGTHGEVMLQVNPSGSSHALFYIKLYMAGHQRSSTAVCYPFLK